MSDTVEETLYCTVHPDRETGLRCNKCNRPMCVECAVATSVGYRCRECVRGIQATYYKASARDDVITFGVAALALALVTYILASARLPILFILILGFPAGGALAEVIIRLTEKRRGRYMPQIAAAGAVIGGVAGVTARLLIAVNEYNQQRGVTRISLDLSMLVQSWMSNWTILLAIGIIAAAVYVRLRMRG